MNRRVVKVAAAVGVYGAILAAALSPLFPLPLPTMAGIGFAAGVTAVLLVVATTPDGPVDPDEPRGGVR